ncbi:MAG TPA: aminopeptidase, partial [Erysipelotrichaceae bacterium]|nr:aminopeptidase [Erysipelotrichaceae bacterium]
MKTVWEKQDAQGMKDIMAFGEDYRQFLSRAKTEREFVHEAKELMEEAGFQNLKLINHPLKAGDRVYTSNRGKNICLFVIGEEPLTEGMNVLGAHIDSPRLDLKQHPLYESDGLALFDTHYYGGIKKYQ